MIGFDEPNLSGNEYIAFGSMFLREAIQIKDDFNSAFDVIYPYRDPRDFETRWDIIYGESTRRFTTYWK